MQITVDSHSGFCFGVVHAIEVAERELRENRPLYCLGDIVHNHMEVDRLQKSGLVIINREEFRALHDCRVMIRAHGEPPETYQTALQNRIELIDATCPIVLTLQNAVYRGYMDMVKQNGQVVIYGQKDHAEVNALNGQTNFTAIVVAAEDDLDLIDCRRPVRLYSQTTKSVDGFRQIVKRLSEKIAAAAPDHPVDFEWHDTICRQVSNRSAKLREFAGKFDVVVFVSGLNSSNGKILFRDCLDVNPNTYLVSGFGEVKREWFENAGTVGICGATSTPGWLMQMIAAEIEKITA